MSLPQKLKKKINTLKNIGNIAGEQKTKKFPYAEKVVKIN